MLKIAVIALTIAAFATPATPVFAKIHIMHGGVCNPPARPCTNYPGHTPHP